MRDLAGCTAIDGNLIITTTALTSLAGLDNLTSVGGDLIIYSNAALPQCRADALATQLGSGLSGGYSSSGNAIGPCP